VYTEEGYGDALARRTDPDTSHIAAARVDATWRELAIWEALEKHFPLGATSLELAAKLGWRRDSVSPRIAPMRSKGLLYDTGERRNGQCVWNLMGRQYA
jgi:hypothetical protein